MIVGYLIFSAGIAVLIGAANAPAATAHDMWVLLTLAGSMVASSTAFLANPLGERTSIKIGRALFAAATGVVGSRVMYTYWSSLREFIAEDKILIFGLGLACGFVGFILAVRFIKTADKKAQDIVDHITKRWDNKYMPPEQVDPNHIKKASESRKPRNYEN